MSKIEDEELLTSTMPTWRENTTLKMPGLLNTNKHHVRRTQTPGVEEEDDAHGGNAARRTSTVGQAFLKPATTSRKQNERKKNATEVRSGVRKETKTTSRQQEEEKMVRGHKEEEGQCEREGGREMNHFF